MERHSGDAQAQVHRRAQQLRDFLQLRPVLVPKRAGRRLVIRPDAQNQAQLWRDCRNLQQLAHRVERRRDAALLGEAQVTGELGRVGEYHARRAHPQLQNSLQLAVGSAVEAGAQVCQGRQYAGVRVALDSVKRLDSRHRLNPSTVRSGQRAEIVDVEERVLHDGLILHDHVESRLPDGAAAAAHQAASSKGRKRPSRRNDIVVVALCTFGRRRQRVVAGRPVIEDDVTRHTIEAPVVGVAPPRRTEIGVLFSRALGGMVH
mmetsp:Transcript_14660/g.41223  ORF Transcript_14660/g.41223 Transcript_14660/m.41223 type:complete len:261 (+) Transcript_14660:893-1675(+)